MGRAAKLRAARRVGLAPKPYRSGPVESLHDLLFNPQPDTEPIGGFRDVEEPSMPRPTVAELEWSDDDPVEGEHGYGGYKVRDCRCEVCRAANAAYEYERRRRPH